MQKPSSLSVQMYMTHDPVSVDYGMSLKDSVAIMAKNYIGNLVIKDNSGRAVGLLTEREILALLYKYGKIPDLKLEEIKLAQFTKIDPETSIAEAAKSMILSKSRLLVCDSQDSLVGIITASDLVRAFFEAGDDDPDLDKVMSKRVASLQDWTSIRDAVRILHRRRIGSLIVTTWEGFYHGIFTERDLLTKIIIQEEPLDKEIGHYCSWFLLTAQRGIRARDTSKLMHANKIKRLPITIKGRIVGIVTARDLVEAYLQIVP